MTSVSSSLLLSRSMRERHGSFLSSWNRHSAGIGQECHAVFPSMSLGVLSDQSVLIVEGQATKIDPTDLTVDGRQKELAVIRVRDVIKSLSESDVTEARVVPPAKLRESTDLRYIPGQTGTWILRRGPREGTYSVAHPECHLRTGNVKLLRELIESRARLPRGAARNGLASRIELVAPASASSYRPNRKGDFHFLRVSLVNVSDREIKLNRRDLGESVAVSLVGP